MAKFNQKGVRPATRSPVKTEPVATGRTYEGAPGYARDVKGELFLLATTNFVSEDTFYEQARDRDSRFVALVRQATLEDPLWVFELARWLRADGNMRSAPIVMAVEFLKARLGEKCPGVPHQAHASSDWTCPLEKTAPSVEAPQDPTGRDVNRAIIDVVLQRGDEPGELLGYWISKYGRVVPKPLKRGVADAVRRLYTEYPLLKYDTGSKGVRFADVLELVHPRPARDKENQGELFEHAIDRRHGHGEEISLALEMVIQNSFLRQAVMEAPDLLLDPGKVRAAGMTWEDVLSLGGKLGLDKQALWMSAIPSMGYMALLRNLRNFDEAGIPDALARQIGDKLADPERVARSRQFPFRFLAAYNANLDSVRWAWSLEQALNHSLANVPALKGRSLILVDRSGSMFNRVSDKSQLNRADSAAVFGTALAMRAQQADLIQFGTSYSRIALRRGSLLPTLAKFDSLGGTDTARAVQGTYDAHDRVIIITDEQAGWGGDPSRYVPDRIPMYTWNLAGYKHGHAPSGEANRHVFGGLTDAAFRTVPLLEAGRNADWPWEEH